MASSLLVVLSLVLCVFSVQTYTPALVLTPSATSLRTYAAPLKSSAAVSLTDYTEEIKSLVSSTAPVIYLIETSGLTAPKLARSSSAFASSFPSSRLEIPYTSGIDPEYLSGDLLSFGCRDSSSANSDLFRFISALNEGPLYQDVAVCLHGEKNVLRAVAAIQQSQADYVAIYTGAATPLTADEPKETIWSPAVWETIVVGIIALITGWIIFRLLFSIPPVTDVELPKRKIA